MNFVTAYLCHVLSTITSYVPTCHHSNQAWSHLDNISLADPHYSSSAAIEILLGADIYAQIILGGSCNGAY